MLVFSEVLIQLLNHEIIPLFFSPRTRSQVMFALLCHGRLAQYCCMIVCSEIFRFRFSFVIVLVFVTKIALVRTTTSADGRNTVPVARPLVRSANKLLNTVKSGQIK